jgi:hypothetical protein
MQAAIAFVVALVSAASVFLRLSTNSFNHFYFLPHRAYPYPYLTSRAAQMALWRDCGLAFVAVFAILYAVQRRFAATRHA